MHNLLSWGGYRIYNPNAGQFLKQDAYSPFRSGQTLNGFSYVSGNPILLVDVTGHMPKKAKLASRGAGGSRRGKSWQPVESQVPELMPQEQVTESGLSDFEAQVVVLNALNEVLAGSLSEAKAQLAEQQEIVDLALETKDKALGFLDEFDQLKQAHADLSETLRRAKAVVRKYHIQIQSVIEENIRLQKENDQLKVAVASPQPEMTNFEVIE